MHYSFYTYSNSHTCIFLINCLFKNVQKQKRKKTQTSQIKSEACAISLWQYLEDMVLGSVVSNSFCDICHRFVRPGLAVVVVFWGEGSHSCHHVQLRYLTSTQRNAQIVPPLLKNKVMHCWRQKKSLSY